MLYLVEHNKAFKKKMKSRNSDVKKVLRNVPSSDWSLQIPMKFEDDLLNLYPSQISCVFTLDSTSTRHSSLYNYPVTAEMFEYMIDFTEHQPHTAYVGQRNDSFETKFEKKGWVIETIEEEIIISLLFNISRSSKSNIKDIFKDTNKYVNSYITFPPESDIHRKFLTIQAIFKLLRNSKDIDINIFEADAKFSSLTLRGYYRSTTPLNLSFVLEKENIILCFKNNKNEETSTFRFSYTNFSIESFKTNLIDILENYRQETELETLMNPNFDLLCKKIVEKINVNLKNDSFYKVTEIDSDALSQLLDDAFIQYLIKNVDTFEAKVINLTTVRSYILLIDNKVPVLFKGSSKEIKNLIAVIESKEHLEQLLLQRKEEILAAESKKLDKAIQENVANFNII